MQQEKLPTIEVVIISYLSADLVRELVQSWGTSLRVCVADNSNGLDGLESITASYGHIRYIPLPSVGYARAANAALRSSTADVVVFANPDCGGTAKDIHSLASGLYFHPDSSVFCHAAFEQIAADAYYPGGWLPSIGRILVHSLGLHHLFREFGIVATLPRPRPIHVHWVAGSLAAYKRSDLVALGGFDERFYLYTEDMALGSVAMDRGFRHVVRPDVIIFPNARGNGAPAAQMTRVQGASFSYYLRVNHSLATQFTCELFLVVGFLGRAIIAAVRGKTALAHSHFTFVLGILTRKAYIERREVSATRFKELGSLHNEGLRRRGRFQRHRSSVSRQEFAKLIRGMGYGADGAAEGRDGADRQTE